MLLTWNKQEKYSPASKEEIGEYLKLELKSNEMSEQFMVNLETDR